MIGLFTLGLRPPGSLVFFVYLVYLVCLVMKQVRGHAAAGRVFGGCEV